MIYIANAFSLQMLPLAALTLAVTPCEAQEVSEALHNEEVRQFIGHADTAAVVGMQLMGEPFENNRGSLTLEAGDTLYVAQITGGRLPEGTTELPVGMKLTWFRVSF